MIYAMAALAIILLIILLFLLLPGKLSISFGSTDKAADLKLYILGGLIKIPLKSGGKADKKEKTDDSKNAKSPEEADKSFFDGINNIFRIIRIIRKTYSQSREYVSKRISADLTVNISFGLYDAALTGIATSAVWTLLYDLLGLLSTVALIEKHKFNVDPVFEDRAMLKADGMCIFRFRPVNIIGILIHILRKYNKVKAEIENVNTH